MENKDYKYYLNLGITETNAGNFDSAIEALDKALEFEPNSAMVYFSKAVVFHNQKELESAYANYTKAIEYNPNMIDAYYNRAQVVMLKEAPNEAELKEALGDLEKAVKLDEKFVDAYYYSAVIKKKFGDYEGAVASLDKVLALEPMAVYSRALKKLILQKYLNKN